MKLHTPIGRMRTLATIAACMAVIGTCAFVQAGPKLSFNNGQSSLELTQTYQFWFIDTYNADKTDARLDAYIRRARFGLKGQVLPQIDYQVQFAFDNLSKDPYTGTIGTGQKVENTEFKVWDAYATYHLQPQFANITFGLQIPQLSREMINSFSKLPSLDNGLTYSYELAAVSTRPSGREAGINIGGLYADSTKPYSASYNVGIYDAAQDKNSTLTGSAHWSPLVTGRAVITLGDPEALTYKLTPDINFFGQRKGISIAGFGSYQGHVDELDSLTKKYMGGFKNNSIYGADMLFNWSWLEIDGEYTFMHRCFTDSFNLADTVIKSAEYTDKAWHIRSSVCIPIGSYYLEPTIMYSEFTGDKYSALYPSGWDHLIDMGVNWYVTKTNAKISLHYVQQNGAGKSLYTSAKGKKRKDYIAAAVQLAL
jgi:hypothetical protein